MNRFSKEDIKYTPEFCEEMDVRLYEIVMNLDADKCERINEIRLMATNDTMVMNRKEKNENVLMMMNDTLQRIV